MYASYPSHALPLPSHVYRLEENNDVYRTVMEGGRARQRKRYETSLKYLSVSFAFSVNQFLVWRMFHREGINMGADYFTMDLLIDDELDTKTVRIVEGTYKASHTDGYQYVVSCVIEAEDMELELEGLYSIFEALAPDSDYEAFLSKGVSSFHTLIHTTIPDIEMWSN